MFVILSSPKQPCTSSLAPTITGFLPMRKSPGKYHPSNEQLDRAMTWGLEACFPLNLDDSGSTLFLGMIFGMFLCCRNETWTAPSNTATAGWSFPKDGFRPPNGIYPQPHFRRIIINYFVDKTTIYGLPLKSSRVQAIFLQVQSWLNHGPFVNAILKSTHFLVEPILFSPVKYYRERERDGSKMIYQTETEALRCSVAMSCSFLASWPVWAVAAAPNSWEPGTRQWGDSLDG